MGNYKKIIIVIFIISSTFIIADKPKKLVFVGSKYLDSPNMRWLAEIQNQALSRMGIDFEFKEVPTRRASYYLNSGLVDGDLARVYSYGDTFENIIRVEEPVTIVTFAAFSTNPSIKVSGWESLKDSNYTFDYKRGVMIVEGNLSKNVPEKNIQVSPTFESGVEKIIRNRVDIYIGNSFEVYRTLEKLQSKNLKSNTVHMVGELEVITNHVYLHKKHAGLAEELSNTLKKKKKEGVFEDLRGKVKIPKAYIKWK
jgi:hypothetical protein